MNPRWRPVTRLAGVFVLSLAAVTLGGCRHKNLNFEENYAAALKNMSKGNYEMAQMQLQQATVQNSDSIEAQYQLALCDLKLKDDTSAYSILRTAEEKDRKSTVSVGIRVELAKMFLAAKQYDNARKRLVWALQREPNNVPARQLLASALVALSEPDSASVEVTRVLTEDPDNLAARVISSAIHLKAHEGAEAEAVLLDGVKRSNRSSDSVMALANFYQLVGQPAKSAELFQEIVQHDPKNIMARTQMGWMYARAGDRATAEKTFREIAKIAPDNDQAQMATANFYLALRDWDKAIAEMERLTKANPKNTEMRNNLAGMYYMSGRKADAQKVVEQLVSENGQDSRAVMLKGMLHMEARQYDQAITEFNHVLYYRGDLAAAHYFLALASAATGQEESAIQHMERALQLSKELMVARVWLIDYNLDRGSKDAAMNYVREAPEDQQGSPQIVVMRALCNPDIQLTPDDQEALRKALLANPGLILKYADHGLGPILKQYGAPLLEQVQAVLKEHPDFRPAQVILLRLLQSAGKEEQALATVQKTLDAHPNSIPDLLTMARLQIHTGRLAAARATLVKADKIRAGTADVMLGLAEVEQDSGNLDAARAHLEELVSRYPKSAEAWGRLGVLDEARHDYNTAKDDYEKAIQLDAKNWISLNNLAQLLADKLGDVDRGLQLARKAHDLNSASPEVDDTLGWIFYRAGNYNDALPLLGEAVKRSPDDAGLHYHLGMAQSKAGREKEALANLQAAIKINPRMPEAGDIRAEMVGLLRSTAR